MNDSRAYIAKATAILASSGLAASAQRVTLLATLLAADDHPSADALYQRLAPHLPTLSKATVYNNLAALTGAGIIEKLDAPDGSRYGPVARTHVNLVCRSCGGIEDVLIGDAELDSVMGRAARTGDFAVHSVSASLYGTCRSCAHA